MKQTKQTRNGHVLLDSPSGTYEARDLQEGTNSDLQQQVRRLMRYYSESGELAGGVGELCHARRYFRNGQGNPR